MVLEGMKQDLVRAAKELFSAGLVLPGEGNLSMRLPGEEAMIITPTMNRYADLETDDIVVIGFDGTVDSARSGVRAPSSEYRLHAAILRQRPKADAVVHTHPPETVAHAVLGQAIPLIVEETAILLGGAVPCAPYRRTGTDDLVSAVLASIGEGNAVMLANHGLLTCGRSLSDAVDAVYLVEKLASVHRRAVALNGGEVSTLGVEDATILSRIFRERFATV